MVLDTHRTKETHYDILSVQETASYEEIRSRYRALILNHHPDKLNPDPSQPVGESFVRIQKAWEVLSDAKSRRIYNNELQASRQEMTASEDVHLDDMMIDDDEEVVCIYYPCRCGDSFSVDSNELEEMGYPLIRDCVGKRLKLPDSVSTTFIIPCGSCSLKRYHIFFFYHNKSINTSSGEAIMSSMMTEIHGVKIEKNPPQSKLDDIGIANWIKWEREPQVIPWTFKPGEIMYFFEGKMKVKVEPHEDWFEIGSGDLVEFPTGMKVVVEVVEAVNKVYRFLTDDDNEAAST